MPTADEEAAAALLPTLGDAAAAATAAGSAAFDYDGAGAVFGGSRSRRAAGRSGAGAALTIDGAPVTSPSLMTSAALAVETGPSSVGDIDTPAASRPFGGRADGDLSGHPGHGLHPPPVAASTGGISLTSPPLAPVAAPVLGVGGVGVGGRVPLLMTHPSFETGDEVVPAAAAVPVPRLRQLPPPPQRQPALAPPQVAAAIQAAAATAPLLTKLIETAVIRGGTEPAAVAKLLTAVAPAAAAALAAPPPPVAPLMATAIGGRGSTSVPNGGALVPFIARNPSDGPGLAGSASSSSSSSSSAVLGAAGAGFGRASITETLTAAPPAPPTAPPSLLPSLRPAPSYAPVGTMRLGAALQQVDSFDPVAQHRHGALPPQVGAVGVSPTLAPSAAPTSAVGAHDGIPASVLPPLVSGPPPGAARHDSFGPPVLLPSLASYPSFSPSAEPPSGGGGGSGGTPAAPPQ